MKLVNMGELFLYDRIGDVPMERAPLPRDDPDRYLLMEGDLLFARQSLKLEGAGRCVYALAADEERTWEGHIIRARFNESVADSRFYYFWFRSYAGRAAIGSIVEQVAAAGVRISDLGRLVVPHPSIIEQRAIADVLWALDDKIDCNRRLATVVDQLVRAEVAHASVGGDPAMVGDLLELIRVTVDPTGVPAETRYVGLEHMPKGSMILDTWGRAAGLASGKAAFRTGDVLFGKLRPYFKKVALATLEPGICSTDILVLRPKRRSASAVALAVLASDDFISFASSAASGTRMPRASWDHMRSYTTVVPTAEAEAQLATILDPLLEWALRGVEQNLLLREVRDTLLPALVTGSLRINVEHSDRDAEGRNVTVGR